MSSTRILIWLSLLAATLALVGCIIGTPTPDSTATTETVQTTPPAPTNTSFPTPTDPAVQETTRRFASPPQLTIDVSAEYTATIRTNHGNIKFELFPGQAPNTVNSFVFLANQGFFDGLTFHRVIENFMIQGGDPQGTGTGGPGYQFQDEIAAGLAFDAPGKLAMANSGVGTGTNGSQFFVTTVSTPHLNGNHTIFGQVLEGQAVVDGISRVSTDGGDRPLRTVTIESIEIVVAPRS